MVIVNVLTFIWMLSVFHEHAPHTASYFNGKSGYVAASNFYPIGPWVKVCGAKMVLKPVSQVFTGAVAGGSVAAIAAGTCTGCRTLGAFPGVAPATRPGSAICKESLSMWTICPTGTVCLP